MSIEGGRRIYGVAIGICLLDRKYPLIPGNVGNPTTYDFPVRVKVIKGLYAAPFTPTPLHPGETGDPLEKTIEIIREFNEEGGVRAIVTACGFFSGCQKELSAASNIPVFTSPLLLIPMIYRSIKSEKKVGILTASANKLSKDFLVPVGVSQSIPIVIKGMEGCREFKEVIGDKRWVADIGKMQNEVVDKAVELVRENPDIGAILLECSDMPPFAYAIQKALKNIPVFDYICMIRMIYHALVQKEYPGFL